MFIWLKWLMCYILHFWFGYRSVTTWTCEISYPEVSWTYVFATLVSSFPLNCQTPDKIVWLCKNNNKYMGVMSVRGVCKGCLKICFIFINPLGDTCSILHFKPRISKLGVCQWENMTVTIHLILQHGSYYFWWMCKTCDRDGLIIGRYKGSWLYP